MAKEIFSIAYIFPEEGKENETLEVLQELYAVMSRKGYSRNTLFRDVSTQRLANLRCWTSEESREQAHEDPDIHRCWARLGQVARVEHVLEKLEEIPARGWVGAS